MDEQRAVGPAAAAYAAALRAAVSGFTAQGGTQREIAVAAHVAPATLSRYLSGERIAPHGFVASLDAFLTERERPLGDGVRERLEGLCGRAHEASRSPAVQLEHLKQELARVRGEKRAGGGELAALKTHADQLAGELERALERARRAETERGLLVRRVDEQEQKLQSAQSYTRRLQAELTAQHDQVVLVQREVEVLRRQNKTLLDENTATTSSETLEGAVPAVSTQAGEGEAEQNARPSLPPRDVPTSTFKPLIPMPPPADEPKRVRLLGRADTSEEFTAQLQALHARAGGTEVWPVDRLVGLSPSRPYGGPTREDRVLMSRWFTMGEYPQDWRRLEPVLRGLGASSLEVKTFSASYARIRETRPTRASHVIAAVLTLAAVAVIWLGATAVLQSDTESWIAKTLTVLGALATSAIVWGTGVSSTLPKPDEPSLHKEWPADLVIFFAPATLLVAIIVPFATGTNAWGHWIADLTGLL
ncbi:hypothetical protein [Streptomyces sp. NBC_01205]|uniref:hypothetical protein n=1 Tax=Streptomyces sp. NBC_01205 TaxID=2903771 RepID=UPI002E122CD6|nr:hypothetical protein OG573_35000 [Streptomyces sp. NBC_01205]